MYSEICNKKLSPPVLPDNYLMQSLNCENPTIEIISENFKKSDVVALVRLFSSVEFCGSVAGIVFRSNEKKQPSLNGPRMGGAQAKRTTVRKRAATDSNAADSNRPAPELVKVVAKLLKRASSLKTLTVIGVSLVNADFRVLSRGLCLNTEAVLSQLTFLRVRTMGDAGLAELSPALCACKAVSIRIVDCNISDFGGVYVASIIRSHGARRDEAIWSAGLRGKAVEAHSEECPKEIPTIGVLVLDFSVNRLGDNSAQAISEALSNDSWLLGLNLGGNNMSDKG